ncbi:hypothetical protein UlMin_037343 [Ulmus minor]
MFTYKPKPKSLPSLSKQTCNPHIFLSSSSSSSLTQTKQAHARIIVSGLGGHGRLLGHLLASLALSPSNPLLYSLSIYRNVNYPSVFSTNNMIRCFAKSDSPHESILLYSSILRNCVKPNHHTFTFVLQACGKALAFQEGAQVHAHAVKFGFGFDVFVRNGLISFYSACCRVELATRVFVESDRSRDLVTWNTMLACFVRDGQVGVAEKVFDEMPQRDVISWSTMITGYVQNGQLEEGLECFTEMRKKGLKPNEAILVSILSASAQLGLLEHGRLVHSQADLFNFRMTASLGTALIDMYAKCGCIEESKILFNKIPMKDIWTWNVMICGLAAHGLGKEGLALFGKLLDEGLSPNSTSFVGVLNACSREGLVKEGRHYFKLMTENYGIKPEMEHYGCMVDLLGRAGLVEEAVELIEKMQLEPDLVLWATLLDACKVHGVLELGEKIGKKLIELDPTHDGHYVQLASVYAKARKWEEVVRVRRLMSERNTNKAAGWSLVEAECKVH